jgi:hypothetical protein
VSGLFLLELVLAAVVVLEAVGLVVLSVLLVRSRRQLEALQARVASRQLLMNGGREAVKTVWETANLVRKKEFRGAVLSSIEELADWAQVERPDLARLTPDGHVVIAFSGATTCSGETWPWRLGWPDRPGGEILISQTVRDHIDGEPDIAVDVGRQVALKGFSGSHHLYSVERAT